jgi:hypothetical protein
MKKPEIKKINFKPAFLKKYDYNVDEIIGVKGRDKFVLYAKKKLIRILRGGLKSKSLLSSYIPIEPAIFYSFEIEKNVLEKVDLEKFIESKVYEEAGVDETEKYVIKYKIIDSMKDEKLVTVEVIIVPEGYIEKEYENIVKETGYLDYISFPAFAYKALYDEKIIQKANDLFAVFLYDKVFLTFYQDGELLSIVTISGGLNKVYESLAKLKIKNYDITMFTKLLTKKGVDPLKYTNAEKAVIECMREEFLSLINIVNGQIEKLGKKYNISGIERIYVTSEYGNIEGLQKYIQSVIGTDTFGFDFYEEYNLDRLAVNPFLFLGMLETHNAYLSQNYEYNYSLFLRKPTFFYRPSGKLFLVLFLSILGTGVYPVYLYFNGLYYEKTNKSLLQKTRQLSVENAKLNAQINKLTKKEKSILSTREKFAKDIAFTKNFIKSIYEFKYSYIPKSNELVDISLLMNKNKVYMEKLDYDNNVFTFDVFSFKDTRIPELLDDLVKKGFNVQTDGIYLKDKKYNATIRIEE